MTVTRSGPPAPLPGTTWLSTFGPAIAQALPSAVEIVLDGMRTRANIRAAVSAIEASHDLRMEAANFIEGTLSRYGAFMSQEVRDEYLLAFLRLMDASHYVIPWGNILPPWR